MCLLICSSSEKIINYHVSHDYLAVDPEQRKRLILVSHLIFLVFSKGSLSV